MKTETFTCTQSLSLFQVTFGKMAAAIKRAVNYINEHYLQQQTDFVYDGLIQDCSRYEEITETNYITIIYFFTVIAWSE